MHASQMLVVAWILRASEARWRGTWVGLEAAATWICQPLRHLRLILH